MLKFLKSLFRKAPSVGPEPVHAVTEFDGLLFVDIESLDDKSNIVELSIVDIFKGSPRVIYHRRFNPFDLPGFQINPFAHKKNSIPLSSLDQAKTFKDSAAEISDFVQGKTVLHFGGSDAAYIKKDLASAGKETDFKSNDIRKLFPLVGNLETVFREKFSDQMELLEGINFHCAVIDSYVTALIYLKEKIKYRMTAADIMEIKKYSHCKEKDLAKFKEEKRNSKQRR